MNGMPSCEDCLFFQPVRVTDPFDGLERWVPMCVGGPDDQCPIEAEHIAEEANVPYCDYCHHRHYGYEDHYMA